MAVVATNHATNPRMRQTSGEVVVATNLIDRPKDLAGAWSGAGDVNEDGVLLTGANPYTSDVTAQTGDTVSGSVDVWSPDARSLTLGTRGTIDGSFASETFTEWVVDVTPGVQRVTFPDHVLDGGSNGFRLRVSGGAPGVRVNRIMMALGSGRSDYFDGDSEPDGTFTYRWTGVSGASTSERVGQNIPTPPGAVGGALVKTTEGALLYGNGNTEQCYVSIPGATQLGIDIKNPTTEQIEVNWYITGRTGSVTDPERRAWIEPGQTIRVTVDEGEAGTSVVRRLDGGGSGISIVGPMFIIDRLMLNGPEPYFDGDTRDDRDSDIWINTSENNRRYYWDSTIKDWAPADEAR